MQKKGKIEVYFNPVGDVYNMERWGYFVKQHEKAVDSIFGKRKDWWYLEALTVEPKFQRHGIGAKLLQWGLERANAAGEDVFLEASPNGLGLYLKNGFKQVAEFTTGGPELGGGDVEVHPCLLHEAKM